MLNVPAPLPTNGFFSLQKLKGKKILLIAARHNKRTNQGEISRSTKIDFRLSHLNESIMGETTPEGVQALAKSLMEMSGIKTLRKDAVLGIECLFSLPVDHDIDEVKYFQECVTWIQIQLDCHVLSADIHRDESSPHCHVLLLPLVGGKMIGSRLMGYKKNLSSLQESFYQSVSKKFGLERPAKSLNFAQRKQAALLVLNHLVLSQDPVTKSNHWPSIVQAIYKFPDDFAKTIGVDMSFCSRPMKTMAEIFTSKGKGVGSSKSHFITQEDKSICSVDFAPKEMQLSHDIKMISDAASHQLVIREDEISSHNFCLETGEFKLFNQLEKKYKG